MDALPPVDFTSPIDQILGTTDDSANANADSKGVDPFAVGKLLAMANAAWNAGNIDLASDLEALAGMQPQVTPKTEISGEESKKEEIVTKGSAAPKMVDKTKAPEQVEKQIAPDVPLDVTPARKSGPSNSEVNEAIWKAYGEKAWEAYVNPRGDGTIDSALRVADAWKANKWNLEPAALGLSEQKERAVDTVGIGNNTAAGAPAVTVDRAKEADAIAAMSSIVDPKSFPNLTVEQVSVVDLGYEVPDMVGKRQGHGFTGHMHKPDENT